MSAGGVDKIIKDNSLDYDLHMGITVTVSHTFYVCVYADIPAALCVLLLAPPTRFVLIDKQKASRHMHSHRPAVHYTVVYSCVVVRCDHFKIVIFLIHSTQTVC